MSRSRQSKPLVLITLIFTHSLIILPAFSETTEEDILESYGADDMVSIATGYRINASTAPSITTVLTSEDIKRIGATRIEDILKTVPGLHVSNSRGFSPVYSIRGVYTETNNLVLVMINGTPIRDVSTGRGPGWSLLVNNISRIEIIRGPGSVLYGADAATGVINIITKRGSEIGGTELGTHIGSFDTYGGWFLHGTESGPVSASVYAEGITTNGHTRTIPRDTQTFNDNNFGTAASLAPGSINLGRDDINAQIEISYLDKLRLRVGYQGQLNLQTGVGVALALDPEGSIDNHYYNADLTYNDFIGESVDFQAKLYFLGKEQEITSHSLPKNTFGGALPFGLINKFEFLRRTIGVESGIIYKGINNHIVHFMGGYEYNWLDDVSNRINATTNQFGLFMQLPQFVEVSQFTTDPLKVRDERKAFHFLLQDEWNFMPDWRLTLGVRYDDFSDFGSTVNPRFSLVWEVDPTLTTKLLYGRAFRPPTFTEVGQSTGNIDPETVDTIELAISKQWQYDLTTLLNVFWYRLDDLIQSNAPSQFSLGAPISFRNTKGLEGYGVEYEMNYRPTDNLEFAFNYAYQHTRDKSANANYGLSPQHQAYVQMDWEFLHGWKIDSNIKWVGKRLRQRGDPRSDLDGYFLAGMTLRSEKIAGSDFDVELTVGNLFNTDAREPSLVPMFLPDDFPLAGRSISGRIRVSF